jgi:hypothetical protein
MAAQTEPAGMTQFIEAVAGLIAPDRSRCVERFENSRRSSSADRPCSNDRSKESR